MNRLDPPLEEILKLFELVTKGGRGIRKGGVDRLMMRKVNLGLGERRMEVIRECFRNVVLGQDDVVALRAKGGHVNSEVSHYSLIQEGKKEGKKEGKMTNGMCSKLCHDRF